MDQLKKSPLDVLLLFSAEKGELERVKHLLALDANINARNEDGETPLLLSMQNSHREVVEYLLTKKPDLTAVDAQGNSIIENMAIAANVEMLNLIIEHHSKAEGIAFLIGAYHKAQGIKKADEYAHIRKILSTNMLKIAVKQGNLESTKRAIDEFKAEIDAQDVSLETALHKAAYLSHIKIVEYLLDAGANTDVQDKHGQTATQVACGENKADIIRLIRHYEILRCVRKCDKDELEKLIGLYADQGLNNYYIFESRNLLVAALRLTRLFAESKRNEILELLLTNGMNVNTVTGNTTPLHIAVELSDKDPIKLLIKAGAMKENKNSAGQTVIEFARASGKADLADYLIEQFAKVKTKKKHGIVSGLSFTTFSKVDDGKQHTSAATGEGKKSTLAPK